MRLIVQAGKALKGVVDLPGDKSLSHRAALFAAMAEGESQIENFLVSGVTDAMLRGLTLLGVDWRLEGATLTVQGKGVMHWRTPESAIDCGNSGTTLRLLAGAIAASGVGAVLTGSEGLRKRPMGRIVDPLRRMGLNIASAEGGTAPLVISPRPAGIHLKPLNETLPVASAQVKTCLLLAALAAQAETVLREPGPSRDHTERMLSSMGIWLKNGIQQEPGKLSLYETRLKPPEEIHLKPLRMRLPGDISSAAFLIAAGCIVPGSELWIRSIGLNPTRTGLLDALRGMGARLWIENESEQGGEPVGDVVVQSSSLTGTEVRGDLVVRMIDEFSVFGAAAAVAQGVTVVREASELRYKESDRIATLCAELARLGLRTEESSDGFKVWGGAPQGGLVEAHGDHRLAMALAVLGLAAQGPVIIEGAEMINESFPAFTQTFISLGADMRLVGEAAPVQASESEVG